MGWILEIENLAGAGAGRVEKVGKIEVVAII